MDYKQVQKLIGKTKNIVFLGESGSGKTEAALNFSLALVPGTRKVHFFDMDQTKGMFRAREYETELCAAGVAVHYQEQMMDLPTLVPAVNENLDDLNAAVVMDVGGGDLGAQLIGQFHQRLNRADTKVFYLANPYRVWTKDRNAFAYSLERILGSCHIQRPKLVYNPTFGSDTTVTQIVDGYYLLKEKIGVSPVFTLVQEKYAEVVARKIPSPVLPLHIFIHYPW